MSASWTPATPPVPRSTLALRVEDQCHDQSSEMCQLYLATSAIHVKRTRRDQALHRK